MSERAADCCHELLEHLYELVDGELSPEDARFLADHLRRCPHCRDVVHGEVEVRRLLRRCWQVSAPDALRLRVIEQTTAYRADL